MPLSQPFVAISAKTPLTIGGDKQVSMMSQAMQDGSFEGHVGYGVREGKKWKSEWKRPR
jgi:hypothetical protein